MTPAIIYRLFLTKPTPAIKHLQQNQFAYISNWALSKKILYECKPQHNSISKKYEKTSCLKDFLFIAGLVDIGDFTFEYLRECL